MSDEARQPARWAGGRGRGWAGGRFRSPVGRREEQVIQQAAAPAPAAPAPEAARTPGEAARTPGEAAAPPAAAPAAGPRGAAERAGMVAAQWAPTAGRVLLGLVLAWFGYHELLLPGEWTGYVPVISQTSDLAIVAVLVHGWVLFVLAVALVAGIAPRVSAAIASVALLEIVISLSVSGLSDTSMRDVGVLGLAVCLTGCRNQRLVLRG
ncbi:MAG TPA: hypothetical protein VKV38_12125 [Trebonia sp.]|jgi:uncharacterized membrane protein YphA (DoxX/SURF4 family)|nr:hypothetical protein [Trebonia sp.]